jgi:hypothetical protein
MGSLQHTYGVTRHKTKVTTAHVSGAQQFTETPLGAHLLTPQVPTPCSLLLSAYPTHSTSEHIGQANILTRPEQFILLHASNPTNAQERVDVHRGADDFWDSNGERPAIQQCHSDCSARQGLHQG